jgi:DNA-binding HxlR family transcriptional regulator
MKGGFGQFCPVAVACEIFAERWTPIILRELIAGSHRFNEIHRHIPLHLARIADERLRDLEARESSPARRAAKGTAGNIT